MAWRPGRLLSWVETLALVLAVACCDAVATGEQQGSRRAATQADAGGVKGIQQDEHQHQHQHHQLERPATAPAVDVAHAMGAPWLKNGRIDYKYDNEGVSAFRDIAARYGDPRALQDTPDVRAVAAAAAAAAASANGIAAQDGGGAPSAAAWPAAQAGGGSDGGGGDGRRRLQDSCSVGGEFTVSSTLYPSSSGCYSLIDPTNIYFYATSAVDRMVAPMPVSEDTSDLLVWATAEVISFDSESLVLSVECVSADYIVEGSHPTDVTSWYCLLAGGLYLVTDESFDMTCGCSDGPTPAPAPVSPTPVDADSPEGDSGCGGTDSFTISSSQLEEFDGCYLDAAADDGDTFFSPTGEKVDGTLAVFPSAVDEQGLDTRWIVGTYAADAEEVDVTCVSTEHPADAHPADSTFVCDLTGTGAYTAVTEDQFGVACGCNSTSSASPSSADTPSPSSLGGGSMVTAAPSVAVADRGIETEGPSPTTPGPAAVAPGVGATVPPGASDAIDTIANSGGGGGTRTAAVRPLVAGAAGALAGLVGSAAVAGLVLW